jgi:hypothetical protein
MYQAVLESVSTGMGIAVYRPWSTKKGNKIHMPPERSARKRALERPSNRLRI